MKLLQLSTMVNSGSTGRIAEDIGKTFMRHGHESYIAFGRGDRPSASSLIRIGSERDVYLHGAKTIFLDRHGFGSTSATRKFVAQVENIRPDVIALHNIHGYYLNIEVLFSYLAKRDIPVIWTLHDCWSFTGHCTYFDDIECKKWITGYNSCPKLHKYPAAFFADSSKSNYADKRRLFQAVKKLEIVVPSAWLAGLVKQSILGDFPCHIIPYGIDIEVFKPSKSHLRELLGLSGKKVVLGCASIWDKRKGLQDIFKLRSILPPDYAFVVVGLSKKQLADLPPGIVGVARTESVQELVDYYSMADVFVNPTYQDNFPTTNLEALACGTPVVTYETGGSPEAVDTRTGMVVKKGDLDALVWAVQKMTAENGMVLEENCRVRAEKLFNKNTQFAEYVRLCESLSTSNN